MELYAADSQQAARWSKVLEWATDLRTLTAVVAVADAGGSAAWLTVQEAGRRGLDERNQPAGTYTQLTLAACTTVAAQTNRTMDPFAPLRQAMPLCF
jgi:hypothetical protein